MSEHNHHSRFPEKNKSPDEKIRSEYLYLTFENLESYAENLMLAPGQCILPAQN